MGWKKRICLLALLFCTAAAPLPLEAARFIRGDANGDSRVDLADVVMILGYLYRGSAERGCLDASDANDDGAVNLADAVRVLEHLFGLGPPPAGPFPQPGFDPTPWDGFTCGDGGVVRAFYVRADAPPGGSGRSWRDAFRRLPRELKRGYTYYVASGTYPAYKFSAPLKGTALITIKRPSEADHGTDEGWDPAYARGTARFPQIAFESGYVLWNGVKGDPKGEQYGFEVFSEEPEGKMVWLLTLQEGVSNVVIRKVEAHRPGRNYRGRGFYAAFGGNRRITLSHCYFHDFHGVHCYFLNARDVLLEHCTFARNASTPLLHSESIQARGTVGLTVRYCVFEDIEGTGVIVSGSGDSAAWRIYGNVFLSTGAFTGGTGHGTIADNFKGSIRDVVVCNNTFLGIRGGKTGVRFFNGREDLVAFNNLYVGCNGVGYVNVKHSYDLYVNCAFTNLEFKEGPSDVIIQVKEPEDIVDRGGRLKVATPAGITLPAPFDKDPSGRKRGADGTWDRGAYEIYDP